MPRRSARFGVLALVLGALSPRAAGAYELKRSTEGSLVRWSEARVAFSVRPEIAEVSGGERAVANAMSAWAGRGGAPELVLGKKSGAGAYPGNDGRNTVFYAPDGHPAASGALAITILSYDDRSGRILDADIVLNGEFKLGRLRAHPAGDAYDVDRVVAHEIGHALGLSDEPGREDALMFPYVAPAVQLPAAPAGDDIAGLSTLYEGASEDAGTVGCGAIVARRSVSPFPIGVLVAASFGVAALALSRGGRRSRRAAMGSAAFAAATLVVPPEVVRSPARAQAHDITVAGAGGGDLDMPDATAVVTAARVTDVAGLFRTDLELLTSSCASSCAPALTAQVWGGKIGHVRQEVGGVVVPLAGERVAVKLAPSSTLGRIGGGARGPLGESQRSVVRAIARLGR